MGSRGKATRKSGITHDRKHKIHIYFGLFVIFLLTISVISYTPYNKSANDGPEYIEQRLIEFYQDSELFTLLTSNFQNYTCNFN